MKPRLRHIAERAGVSEATVSRVLNDKPGVAGDTRRDVLAAVAELGYTPTGVSSAPKTRLVGLIVPELDNAVFPRFAQALESKLAGSGYTTVLCTSTPAGRGEPEYRDVLIDHGVSGIVLVSGLHADTQADHRGYLDLVARRIPTVVVNGRTAGLAVPSVTVDHIEAARLGVAHLAALGHQQIGLALGPGRYVQTTELLAGYLEGLERAGLPANEDLVTESIYGIEGGRAAGLSLLERGVTGVFCASDPMALGVVRGAREQGLRVPEDVSIIGFDDAGPNPYFDPPLTSVQQPFVAMSNAVVTLLSDPPSSESEQPELRFRPELVVRGSTHPVGRDL